MDLKNFTTVIVLCFVLLGIALLLPESETKNEHVLPWQIEQVEDTTHVFGLTLGKSTLLDAQKIFQGAGEISLFNTPLENNTSEIRSYKNYVIEVYFDKVILGGLTAKIILVMDFTQAELEQMYLRGVRISKISSGSNKVSISTKDLHLVSNTPIASITYLPSINLSAEQIIARFGEPEKRIIETEIDSVDKSENLDSPAIEHWLYRSIGLDIILNEKSKEVFQYVKPTLFHTAIELPLLTMQDKNTLQ